MKNICPFMSKPKLAVFPDGKSDGTYDEFVECQQGNCMAWCEASEITDKREKFTNDVIYEDVSYCKLLDKEAK